MFYGFLLGLPVAQEGGTGAGGEGFESGVAFFAEWSKDHGAFIFDVKGELGGGVEGFI